MENFIQLLSDIFPILGVGGIISGFVIGRLNKMEKRQEQREEARKKESILVIKGLQACGHLSEAMAIETKRGGLNGETDTALEYYKKFSDELGSYLLQQNAERNHG